MAHDKLEGVQPPDEQLQRIVMDKVQSQMRRRAAAELRR